MTQKKMKIELLTLNGNEINEEFNSINELKERVKELCEDMPMVIKIKDLFASKWGKR